jgi:hypothetical protein
MMVTRNIWVSAMKIVLYYILKTDSAMARIAFFVKCDTTFSWKVPPSHERLANNKEVLTPEVYLRDLREEATRATKHVVLQAMDIEDSNAGKLALDVFASVPTGVTKELYIDAYALMTSGDRIHDYRSRGMIWGKPKEKLMKRIEATGTRIIITNIPKNFVEPFVPFIGRNHMKGADVDGRVFYFGGANFDRTDWADFMVKFTGDIAEKLSKAFEDAHAGRISEDEQRELDRDTYLCIDAGKPEQSLIMERAAEMITRAETSVECVSMLLPDGSVAKALKEATARGVQGEVVSSSVAAKRPLDPSGADSIVFMIRRLNRFWHTLSRSKVKIHDIPRGVHAKLLIVDGKYAYFGSHNLSESGVKAGTKEWGIFTSDPELVRNLRETYLGFKSESL